MKGNSLRMRLLKFIFIAEYSVTVSIHEVWRERTVVSERMKRSILTQSILAIYLMRWHVKTLSVQKYSPCKNKFRHTNQIDFFLLDLRFIDVYLPVLFCFELRRLW